MTDASAALGRRHWKRPPLIANPLLRWSLLLDLIDKAGVVVTPGNAFGPGGEGFFRVSLIADENVLGAAIDRLRAILPITQGHTDTSGNCE